MADQWHLQAFGSYVGTAGDEQGPVRCTNAANEEPAGTLQPAAVTP